MQAIGCFAVQDEDLPVGAFGCDERVANSNDRLYLILVRGFRGHVGKPGQPLGRVGPKIAYRIVGGLVRPQRDSEGVVTDDRREKDGESSGSSDTWLHLIPLACLRV